MGRSVAENIAASLFDLVRFSPIIDALVAFLLRILPTNSVVTSLRSRLTTLAAHHYVDDQNGGLRSVPLGRKINFQIHLGDHSGALYYNPRAIEPDSLDFVREFLTAGDTFVDIGANRGLYSLIAAGIVGDKGNVFSFEPNPAVYGMLVENQRSNRLDTYMKAFNLAMAEKNSASIKFYLSKNPNNSGLSTLTPDPELIAAGKLGEDRVIEVAAQTFDTFAEKMAINHIDLMKIDAEGAEFLVLQGMEETIRKGVSRALIIETKVDHELVSWLNERRYESRILEMISPRAKLANLLFLKS